MFSKFRTICLALSAFACWPVSAADLQASPTVLDIAAPQAAATISLRTSGPEQVNVQVRVYRWIQERGVERLEPTRDLVASPPAARISPGKDYLVRIVRVSKNPLSSEESYRLLVDQLPVRSKPGAVAVKLVVRHSIPVFFNQPGAAIAALTWSASRSGNDLFVTATNAGDKRERVSGLSLKDQSGRAISFGEGLLGYVLGNTSMTWMASGKGRNFARKGRVRLSAQGYEGRIDENVSIAIRN